MKISPDAIHIAATVSNKIRKAPTWIESQASHPQFLVDCYYKRVWGSPLGLIPPHPGAGIAIMGYTWVSGWYPAATELTILKKACVSQKSALVVKRFCFFEKTRCLSRLPHAYFLYVGVPRWATKLFRIEEENMLVAKIQTGRNSFTKIPLNPPPSPNP